MTRSGLCCLLLVVASGCDPRLYDRDRPQVRDDRTPAGAAEEAKQGEKDDEEQPARPALNPLAALGALGAARQPGPFDEPLRSEAAKSGAPGSAVLELRGRVVEIDAPFSFSLDLLGGGESVALRSVIERLRDLERSDVVANVVLRLGDLSLSMAAAEELRAALVSAKKPVHCHAETLDNTSVVLASACASLGLAPAGVVQITGPVVLPLYFRGLLDKLGVEADFVHIGAYKGAAEPLTRRAPSKEMRETYEDLVDGMYRSLVAHLAEGREVAPEQAAAWIDEGLYTAEAAKAAGIVDEILPFHEFRDARAPGGAWRRERWKEGAGGMEDLMTMLGLRPKKRVRGPHLALLYAVGSVVHGGGRPGGAFDEVASGKLVPALRAAAADDDVRAIVLRIDSPGGSALASELIYRAVREAAAKKPVIASMGSVAASGGYYIAAGAAKIYAQPDTLTGSIGVVGGKLVFGDTLEKLGVDVAEISRGKRAMMLSPVRPWTADERAAMLRLMEDIYTTFKARVAEGRKLDPAEVERHAQGRVFTGSEALARGLVDELGSLEDAIAFARQAAKLPDDAAIDVYPGQPTLFDLLGGLAGARARASVLAGVPLAGVADLAGARVARAARELVELALAFGGDEKIRTVAFLPVVR